MVGFVALFVSKWAPFLPLMSRASRLNDDLVDDCEAAAAKT